MSKIAFTVFFCTVTIILCPDTMAAGAKDRFNLYKGLLHLKDDGQDLSESIDDNKEIKPSYFYRVPIAIRSETSMKQLPVDMGKRTVNRFKNYMLEKNSQDEIFHKAGLGSVYDWYLPNRENINQE